MLSLFFSAISIECSDFWGKYMQNSIYLKFATGLDLQNHQFNASNLKTLSLPLSRESLPLMDNQFFRCGNDQCVLFERRCDGFADCVDHSDEQNCPTCSNNSTRYFCHQTLQHFFILFCSPQNSSKCLSDAT